MSSDSVKVCDLELEKLAELAECWDEIDSILNQYSNIMKKVFFLLQWDVVLIFVPI